MLLESILLLWIIPPIIKLFTGFEGELLNVIYHFLDNSSTQVYPYFFLILYGTLIIVYPLWDRDNKAFITNIITLLIASLWLYSNSVWNYNFSSILTTYKRLSMEYYFTIPYFLLLFSHFKSGGNNTYFRIKLLFYGIIMLLGIYWYLAANYLFHINNTIIIHPMLIHIAILGLSLLSLFLNIKYYLKDRNRNHRLVYLLPHQIALLMYSYSLFL